MGIHVYVNSEGKFVPVYAMRAYIGSGGIPPFSLIMDTRWKYLNR